jgi:hypothetical protein
MNELLEFRSYTGGFYRGCGGYWQSGKEMSKEILLKISGVPVYWDGEVISYQGEMTCLQMGIHGAGPEGCHPEPLDYLGNAGYPGNWWGVTTDKYGNPYIQQESSNDAMHPYPGLYVSCTAYYHAAYPEYDCRRCVNPETTAFR